MTEILVADDQSDVRTAVVQLLLSFNRPDLAIDQVCNGADALRRLQSRSYDLMISDTHMPGMSVAELMAVVRSDEKLKSLPVILMLAVGAGKKDVMSAVALQISAFVIKPFRPDQLHTQIRNVLGW